MWKDSIIQNVDLSIKDTNLFMGAGFGMHHIPEQYFKIKLIFLSFGLGFCPFFPSPAVVRRNSNPHSSVAVAWVQFSPDECDFLVESWTLMILLGQKQVLKYPKPTLLSTITTTTTTWPVFTTTTHSTSQSKLLQRQPA